MRETKNSSASDATAAQACAEALRRLGWAAEAVGKILAGPDKSSVHDIAGRRVEAKSLETLDASAVAVLGMASASAPAGEAAPLLYDIGQKQIADAVWVSVSEGDPIPLAAIARQLPQMPAPMQVYLLAASREVKRYYQDLQAWKRAFVQAQREAQAGRGKEKQQSETLAGAAAGVIVAVATAAAAANAVPVVGQVVSALMALGLAIGTAVAEANALPARKAEERKDAARIPLRGALSTMQEPHDRQSNEERC